MATDEKTPASEAGGGRRDLGVGVASAALGIVLLVAVIPGTVGPLGADKTILAMLAAVGLILFGAILAASNFSALREPTDPTVTRNPDVRPNATKHANPEAGRDGDDDAGARIAAIGTLAIILVYAATLEWLGYVLASYLCLAALMSLLGVRSLVRLVILPALIVGAVYVGIDVALGSHLPEGEIEWRHIFSNTDTLEDR